jgi:hypothetical protein
MRLTVIYDDKFIKIDGKGMFFADNWPFEETDIHAVQWYDDHGELEYKTAIPNKELTKKSQIKKYLDFFNEEYAKWEAEQTKIEEEEKQRLITWEEAMRELELQMDMMQKNHQEEIEKVIDDHTERLESLNQQRDREISMIYEKVQENQANLQYAENFIADSSISVANREQTVSYEDITIFDSNVDPSLFDDSIDPSTFEVDNSSEPTVEPAVESPLEDFNNFDLSLLEDEFNLEMLFEEDPDPVVNEIEELIAQDEVNAAEIPDNKEE